MTDQQVDPMYQPQPTPMATGTVSYPPGTNVPMVELHALCSQAVRDIEADLQPDTAALIAAAQAVAEQQMGDTP